MRPAEYREFRFHDPKTNEEISLSIYWDKQPIFIEQTLIDFPVYTLLRAWEWTAEVWFDGQFHAEGHDVEGYMGELLANSVEELVQSAIKYFGEE